MRTTVVMMSVLLALIISQTSDSTYSYNDGNGNTGVVVIT